MITRQKIGDAVFVVLPPSSPIKYSTGSFQDRIGYDATELTFVAGLTTTETQELFPFHELLRNGEFLQEDLTIAEPVRTGAGYLFFSGANGVFLRKEERITEDNILVERMPQRTHWKSAQYFSSQTQWISSNPEVYVSILEHARQANEVESFFERVRDSLEPRVALQAEQVWADILEEYGNSLPIPLVARAPDGNVLFSWTVGDHYLEIEVHHSHSEIFYENTRTEEAHCKDVEIGSSAVQAAGPWFKEIVAEDAWAHTRSIR